MTDPKKKDAKENVMTSIESIDIEDKVRIILELYKQNKLIYTSDNYNSFLIPNQVFEGIPIVLPDPKSKVVGISANYSSAEPEFTSEHSLCINL